MRYPSCLFQCRFYELVINRNQIEPVPGLNAVAIKEIEAIMMKHDTILAYITVLWMG